MSSLVRINRIPQIRSFASKCKSGSKAPVAKKYSKRMVKLKKLQEKFQRDDGKPIFLKNGGTDRLLYLSTVGLCFVGLALDIKLLVGYIFFD